MKRITTFLTGLAVLLCFAANSALAQRSGGAGGGNDVGGLPMNGASRNVHGSTSGPSIEPTIERVKPEDVLAKNAKLSSKVQDLLPPGINALQAASGFKDVKQFVAAVHASKNLGISLTDLKTKILGGDSLGKAIKALKPDADAKEEAKKAEKEAKSDIKEAKA
jgi:hypothetical protein